MNVCMYVRMLIRDIERAIPGEYSLHLVGFVTIAPGTCEHDLGVMCPGTRVELALDSVSVEAILTPPPSRCLLHGFIYTSMSKSSTITTIITATTHTTLHISAGVATVRHPSTPRRMLHQNAKHWN